ncbi:MAG: hypothetical protein P1U65_09345 [Minwuia sp.]|nr:hypothetical protein [Minwuia sp.]
MAGDSITAVSDEVPTAAQIRYLARGLTQPGGKLPLFDEDGQAVPVHVVRACVDRGLATPWFSNPIKPDWLVCRLTDRGRCLMNVTGTAIEEVPVAGETGSAASMKIAANDAR